MNIDNIIDLEEILINLKIAEEFLKNKIRD